MPPKLFIRAITLLLIPCLVGDPAFASSFSRQEPSFNAHFPDRMAESIFHAQAFAVPLLSSGVLERTIHVGQRIKMTWGRYLRGFTNLPTLKWEQKPALIDQFGNVHVGGGRVPKIKEWLSEIKTVLMMADTGHGGQGSEGRKGTSVEVLRADTFKEHAVRAIFWDWGGTLGYWPTGMADGAVEFLQLAQQLGIRNILVTSAPRDEVDHWMQTHGIANSFAEIICPDDKTNPIDKAVEIDAYLKRHAEELSPLEAVGMGDDPVKDLAAFKQAGIASVAVLIPKSKFTREQLLSTDAAAIVSNDFTKPESILALLGHTNFAVTTSVPPGIETYKLKVKGQTGFLRNPSGALSEHPVDTSRPNRSDIAGFVVRHLDLDDPSTVTALKAILGYEARRPMTITLYSVVMKEDDPGVEYPVAFFEGGRVHEIITNHTVRSALQDALVISTGKALELVGSQPISGVIRARTYDEDGITVLMLQRGDSSKPRNLLFVPVLNANGTLKGGASQEADIHARVTRGDIKRFDDSIRAIPSSAAIGRVRILGPKESKIFEPFDEADPQVAALLRSFRDALMRSGATLEEIMEKNGLEEIVLERGGNNFVGETTFKDGHATLRIHSQLKGHSEELVFMEEVAWLKLGHRASQAEVAANSFQSFMHWLNYQGLAEDAFFAAIRALDFGVAGGIGNFVADALAALPLTEEWMPTSFRKLHHRKRFVKFDLAQLAQTIAETILPEVDRRFPGARQNVDGKGRHLMPVPAGGHEIFDFTLKVRNTQPLTRSPLPTPVGPQHRLYGTREGTEIRGFTHHELDLGDAPTRETAQYFYGDYLPNNPALRVFFVTFVLADNPNPIPFGFVYDIGEDEVTAKLLENDVLLRAYKADSLLARPRGQSSVWGTDFRVGKVRAAEVRTAKDSINLKVAFGSSGEHPSMFPAPEANSKEQGTDHASEKLTRQPKSQTKQPPFEPVNLPFELKRTSDRGEWVQTWVRIPLDLSDSSTANRVRYLVRPPEGNVGKAYLVYSRIDQLPIAVEYVGTDKNAVTHVVALGEATDSHRLYTNELRSKHHVQADYQGGVIDSALRRPVLLRTGQIYFAASTPEGARPSEFTRLDSISRTMRRVLDLIIGEHGDVYGLENLVNETVTHDGKQLGAYPGLEKDVLHLILGPAAKSTGLAPEYGDALNDFALITRGLWLRHGQGLALSDTQIVEDVSGDAAHQATLLNRVRTLLNLPGASVESRVATADEVVNPASENAKVVEPKRTLRVLIADDEARQRTARRSVVESLSQNFDLGNVEIEEAVDGVPALEKFKQAAASGKPFDVVITDNLMGEMFGMRLAEEIREYEKAAAQEQSYTPVPIILVTTWADRSTAIQAGITDIVMKKDSNLPRVLSGMVAKYTGLKPRTNPPGSLVLDASTFLITSFFGIYAGSIGIAKIALALKVAPIFALASGMILPVAAIIISWKYLIPLTLGIRHSTKTDSSLPRMLRDYATAA